MTKKEFLINKFIIHEFKKESGSTDSVPVFSDKAVETIEESNAEVSDDIEIVRTIHHEFTGLSKHTVFQERNDNIFKKELENSFSRPSIDSFYEFTTKSLFELQKIIKTESFAVGGYYLFTDYTLNDKRFIIVVLIRNREKNFGIQFEDKKYKVKKTGGVNLDKISIGFRLNYEIYEKRFEVNLNQNYIGLITSASEISQYFIDWVAAANILKGAENTDAFLNIIKTIDLPKNESNEEIISREDLLQLTYNEYKSRTSVDVDVRNFCTKVFGEKHKDYIMNYASVNNISLDNNFKRALDKLKKLAQVSASVEGIDITIDYKKFNHNEATINKNKTSLTIKSTELVSEILKQYPNAYRD